ncbi:hypothetical protein RI054_26g109590 [Pseudoscourfieldia marina]
MNWRNALATPSFVFNAKGIENLVLSSVKCTQYWQPLYDFSTFSLRSIWMSSPGTNFELGALSVSLLFVWLLALLALEAPCGLRTELWASSALQVGVAVEEGDGGLGGVCRRWLCGEEVREDNAVASGEAAVGGELDQPLESSRRAVERLCGENREPLHCVGDEPLHGVVVALAVACKVASWAAVERV